MPNSIKEATNRGNNLLMVVFMAILTFGVILHQFSETELLDKADDIVFIILGFVTVAWYLRGRNRYRYNWFPLGMLGLGLLDKVLAFFLNELNDPSAATDEYAIGVLLVIIIVLSGVIMLRTREKPLMEVVSLITNVAIPQTGKTNDQV